MASITTRSRLGVAALALSALAAACTGADSDTSPDRDAGTSTPPSPYGPGWAAVHADGGNRDFVATDGPTDVSLAWERDFDGAMYIGPLEWTINLGPTISADGDRIYLSSTVEGCHLQAIDAATGETDWCSPEVDQLAVVSSALVDREHRLFIADGEAMHAFEPDGTLIWEVPIEGVPFSAQFIGEGRLVFVTHLGTVYVLDRATGEPMLEPMELVPGAQWEPSEGLLACAQGRRECPSANTIAVSPDLGTIYFTFWGPGAEQAGVRALSYSEDPEPRLTELWSTDALPGGSGSSPTLSADGTRLYTTDNVDSLHALDTADGELLWSTKIGYSAGGSPSISPDGVILPAGGRGSAVQGVTDAGDRGAPTWTRDDLGNRGVVTQAGGGVAYAVVDRGERQNDLVVLDVATGDELDREPLPGVSVFGVGTTVGPDGTVYVPTVVGRLYAFRPAD